MTKKSREAVINYLGCDNIRDINSASLRDALEKGANIINIRNGWCGQNGTILADDADTGETWCWCDCPHIMDGDNRE